MFQLTDLTMTMQTSPRLMSYNIDVNGTVVGFVPFSEVFRYLGSHIHRDWSLSDEFDVKHRITSANGAFGALSGTLCDRRVNYALKGKFYCTLVFSILYSIKMSVFSLTFNLSNCHRS